MIISKQAKRHGLQMLYQVFCKEANGSGFYKYFYRKYALRTALWYRDLDICKVPQIHNCSKNERKLVSKSGYIASTFYCTFIISMTISSDVDGRNRKSR